MDYRPSPREAQVVQATRCSRDVAFPQRLNAAQSKLRGQIVSGRQEKWEEWMQWFRDLEKTPPIGQLGSSGSDRAAPGLRLLRLLPSVPPTGRLALASHTPPLQ